jgi:hypothetical protein
VAEILTIVATIRARRSIASPGPRGASGVTDDAGPIAAMGPLLADRPTRVGGDA